METPKVGQLLQFKIGKSEYRPFLAIRVSESNLVTGYLFPDLWNDDKKLMGLGIGMGGLPFLRFVPDVAQGDQVGQWRFIE